MFVGSNRAPNLLHKGWRDHAHLFAFAFVNVSNVFGVFFLQLSSETHSRDSVLLQTLPDEALLIAVCAQPASQPDSGVEAA